LRLATRMDHRVLIFDLLPLETFLVPRRVEALAVLPGDVEQAPRHLRTDVRILDLEGRRLDRERAAVFRDQLLVDPPGAVADDALGMFAEKRETRADAVRRIVHRREALPVA